MSGAEPLVLDGRFARFSAIEWWDQRRLAAARVLVVGAGALGNEVIKNLSLLGVGRLVIVDRDVVERSNLSRSVLFRESDEGQAKADCAARAASGLYPACDVRALVADVTSGVGLGLFRWAEVVVGALDNREARVFLNAACARVGRPFVEGGIEVLQGIARGFAPPRTACYECTMSQLDWELLNQSRSCALLARRALAERGTPTTPTTASVIGGIQAQEVVKLLHGREALLGRGFVFDGASHASYAVDYQIKPGCPWHEAAPAIEAEPALGLGSPLEEVWRRGVELLGEVDALELSREVVSALECSRCSARESLFAPASGIDERRGACPACGTPRAPVFLHSLTRQQQGLLGKSAGEIGLPPWDVVFARRDETLVGIELAADRARVMGGG